MTDIKASLRTKVEFKAHVVKNEPPKKQEVKVKKEDKKKGD